MPFRVKLKENFFDGRQLWRKGVQEFPDDYSVPFPKSAVRLDKDDKPVEEKEESAQKELTFPERSAKAPAKGGDQPTAKKE